MERLYDREIVAVTVERLPQLGGGELVIGRPHTAILHRQSCHRWGGVSCRDGCLEPHAVPKCDFTSTPGFGFGATERAAAVPSHRPPYGIASEHL